MECKRWREKRTRRRQRDEEKKPEEENEMSREGGVQLDVVAARSGMRFAHSFVSVCLKPGPNVRLQSWNKWPTNKIVLSRLLSLAFVKNLQSFVSSIFNVENLVKLSTNNYMINDNSQINSTIISTRYFKFSIFPISLNFSHFNLN